MWSRSGEEGWWWGVNECSLSVKHRCLPISVYPFSEKVAALCCYEGIIEDDGNWLSFSLYMPPSCPTHRLPSTLKAFIISVFWCQWLFLSTTPCCAACLAWKQLSNHEAVRIMQLRGQFWILSSSCNTVTATCTCHAQNWCGATKAFVWVHPKKYLNAALFHSWHWVPDF